MKKKIISLGLSLTLSLFQVIVISVSSSAPAYGGGQMMAVDITGREPSPVPGYITGRNVPFKWDSRAIPVVYSMNATLDPIPTPIGTPTLTVADAKNILQNSFDQWNNIPTSFIDMKIQNTANNTGLAGFDFVNELTFRYPDNFGGIAVSPSTYLIEDSNFIDGADLDRDGDSDVSRFIESTKDYDGDGDIEFPAGFYKAGTMLDNDVLFNARTYRFTINDADIDAISNSIDLMGIAVHEFGHSHGLSHTLDNQLSDTDGTGATMFPFIDTRDPNSEIAIRSLSSDDIAWSSYVYQEGTSWDESNPAYCWWGDGEIPFEQRYAVIKGSLTHGLYKEPLAGAHVFAVKDGTNTVVASGFSGTTRTFYNPVDGRQYYSSAHRSWQIENGNYAIPVPAANPSFYNIGIQPVDGLPVPSGSISTVANVGNYFGQQNFVEEFYNKCMEDSNETRIGERESIEVRNGWDVTDKNLITSDVRSIQNFRPYGGSWAFYSPGALMAVRIPASQVLSINQGGDILIQALGLGTSPRPGLSFVPKFASAMLTTGQVNIDGTISVDLANPIAAKAGFVGQDTDHTPLYFDDPALVGKLAMERLNKGSFTDLFIVLQNPIIDYNGIAPAILAGSFNPFFPTSYYSWDGYHWNQDIFLSFHFSLITSIPVVAE